MNCCIALISVLCYYIARSWATHLLAPVEGSGLLTGPALQLSGTLSGNLQFEDQARLV